MENGEDFNYEYDYLKDFVIAYLASVDSKNSYQCRENGSSFLFIKSLNFILCEEKDFHDSMFFAEVHIDWNHTQFFPVIRKDSFGKINVKDLRDYIAENISSLTEIQRLLKLNPGREDS
jgi:hypothetical protein